LAAPVLESLGGVFPELRRQEPTLRRVIRSEEESFGRTLERGLRRFDEAAAAGALAGPVVFELYDTYGFPVDLTQVIALERGLRVDVSGFDALMGQQRERGRAAQKKEIVVAATEGGPAALSPTVFTGYALDPARGTHAILVDVLRSDHGAFLVFDRTPFYAEMGGQVGDTGHALAAGKSVAIVDTVLSLIHISGSGAFRPGASLRPCICRTRRRATRRTSTRRPMRSGRGFSGRRGSIPRRISCGEAKRTTSG